LAAFAAKEYFFKTLILLVLRSKTNKISVLKNFWGCVKSHCFSFGGWRRQIIFFLNRHLDQFCEAKLV